MMQAVVVRLRQPLHLSHLQKLCQRQSSCQRQAFTSIGYRISHSHPGTQLPQSGSGLLSTTATNVSADALEPTTIIPSPILPLPEGMPDVVGLDDSSLLKALIDYQGEQQANLLEYLKSSEQRRFRTALVFVEKTVRAAECALMVLDRIPRPTPAQFLLALDTCSQASAATATTRSQRHFKGIPQRAELVLEKMEQRRLPLTIKEFNCVLKLWANSKEYLQGSSCERFFNKVFAVSDQKKPVEPNAESYRWIIRAWLQSEEVDAAHRSTDYLMMWRANDVDPPQLEDFQLILKQWTQSSSLRRSLRAWRVLESMLDWDIDKTKLVRPDRTCYRYCLQSLSSTFLPDLGKHADRILNLMFDRQVLPDTECYLHAISTWKNTAILTSNPKVVYAAAERANALLDDMSTAYHRSSLVVVKPSTHIYNEVLRAWHAAASGHEYVLDKSEEILMTMEQSTDETIWPDVHSYRLVLDTLAMQKKPSGMSKLKRAEDILQRMKTRVGEMKAEPMKEALVHNEEKDEEGDNVDLSKPAVAVYNAFLRVCASIKVKDEADQTALLRRAFEVLNEMEKDPILDLHSSTYQAFLDVVTNATGINSKECTYAAERVFQKCCRHGLLNRHILKSFKVLVPPEVFQRVVLDRCTRDGTDQKWLVPQEWTRHSTLPTIPTEHGRQQLPLSVEGRYIVPPEALDFKARNLRLRTGQKLLQGGRINKTQ